MKSDTSAQAAERRLDPRTEELLREIAASGDSCLLRASRRELGDALSRADYLGLRTQVGFSSAERELLRTARAEVAYWLNVICFRRLTEDEATRRYYTRLGAADREYVPPSTDDLSSGAHAALAQATEMRVEDLSAAELLVAGATTIDASGSRQRPGVVELAAASLRLHPTFQARHYAIQAMAVVPGAAVRAIACAQQLAAVSSNRSERGYAHAMIGTLIGRAGDPASALASYRCAASLLPSHSELIVRALVAATHAGDRASRRDLLAELESRGEREPVWTALLRHRGSMSSSAHSDSDRLNELMRPNEGEARLDP